MIITRLEGGLGNQMFQYAAARRLAEKHSSSLKLDLSWFKTQQLRQYKLQCFDIIEDFATEDEIEIILGNYSLSRRLFSKINHKLGIKQSSADLETYQATSGIIFSHTYARWLLARTKYTLGLHRSDSSLYKQGKYIREKHHHFDPAILEAPDDIYMDGFWQSPNYFSDIEETLRQEFRIKLPKSPLFNEIAEQIVNNNYSVSLHVRRGDMANNPETNRLHGVCNLDYYQQAIEYISGHVNQIHFFIFSDEPEWVKENLRLKFSSTLVSCYESLTDYEEMSLMSLCQHHITANSTFSWWGAWLNPNPDKLIIAPQKFFEAFAYDRSVKDLYPRSWVTL